MAPPPVDEDARRGFKALAAQPPGSPGRREARAFLGGDLGAFRALHHDPERGVVSGAIFGDLFVPRRERRAVDLAWPGGVAAFRAPRRPSGLPAVPGGWERIFLGPIKNKVTNLGLEMLAKRNFSTGGSLAGGILPSTAIAHQQGLGVDNTSRTTTPSLEGMTQLSPATDNCFSLFSATPTFDGSTANLPFVDAAAIFDQSMVDFSMLSIAVGNLAAAQTNVPLSTNNYIYAVISNLTVDLRNVSTWQWTPTYRSTFQSAT